MARSNIGKAWKTSQREQYLNNRQTGEVTENESCRIRKKGTYTGNAHPRSETVGNGRWPALRIGRRSGNYPKEQRRWFCVLQRGRQDGQKFVGVESYSIIGYSACLEKRLDL
jgi:hypothetical protein